MSALDHCPQPLTGAARPAYLARVVRTVTDYLRVFRNRRQAYRLGEMSDYELADIGLTRADLSVAFRSPIGVDPTVELGIIAEARACERLEAACRIC